MRALFTYLLAGLLLACPFVCKATDDGCCAEEEVAGGPAPERNVPVSSDGSTSCICGGAINATDNRIHGSGPDRVSPSDHSFLFDCIPLHLSSLTLQLAEEGAPPEEDGWRGYRRVHALFQHFRC